MPVQDREGKERVKNAMAQKATPQERFEAFVNGVLDNATALIEGGATKEDQLTLIAELRGQLGEAWDDIQARGKSGDAPGQQKK